MMKELKNQMKLPRELYEDERLALEKFAAEEEARKAAERNGDNAATESKTNKDGGEKRALKNSEKTDSNDGEESSESSD